MSSLFMQHIKTTEVDQSTVQKPQTLPNPDKKTEKNENERLKDLHYFSLLFPAALSVSEIT